MAKSKIIKELANNEISLEVALNRLLIIASDIGNDELAQWSEKELNGYTKNDTVPDYRVAKNTQITYSGINGRYQVTDAPLSLQGLFKDEPDMFNVKLVEGIKIIEGLAFGDKKEKYGMDLTYLAGLVQKTFGIQCISITQTIPINILESVVNTVKTTLLKILIKLDKSYGNLDDLDIDMSSKTPEEIRQINTVINQYIYSDNSITIGDKNKIDDSKIIGRGLDNGNKK